MNHRGLLWGHTTLSPRKRVLVRLLMGDLDVSLLLGGKAACEWWIVEGCRGPG